MEENQKDTLRPIQSVPNEHITELPKAKHHLHIVPIVVALTLLLISAGGYILSLHQSKLLLGNKDGVSQNPQQKTVALSPTPSQTESVENWKTYRNEEYGFEFKYPNELVINPELPDDIGIIAPYMITDPTTLANYSSIRLDRKYIRSGYDTGVRYNGLGVFLLTETEETTSDELASKYIEKYNKPTTDRFELTKGNLTINGRKWSIVYSKSDYPINYHITYLDNNTFLVVNKMEINKGVFNKEFDQILSTFTFINNSNTTEYETEQVIIFDDHSFDIQFPTTYSMKKTAKDSIISSVTITDKNQMGISITTYAGGERTPVGTMIIDGVPFTINYFKELQCLADIDASNWTPGTKPLFNIHINCDQATNEQLGEYSAIIQSIRFSPSLKKVLMGQ